MAMIEEFDKQGNWLFRHRSHLPIFIVVIGFIVFGYDMSYSPMAKPLYIDMIYFAVSILGLFIRIITVGYTPAKTSGRNTKKQVSDSLNTTGIYSLVRHPLYLGNFFMWLGLILFIENHWFSIVFCLIYWIYYERIMFAEEMFLRKKFGNIYLDWAGKTPAFIPSFRNYSKTQATFSLPNVIKREFYGLFAVVFLFTCFKALEYYFNYGQIGLDFFWHIFFICNLLLFVIIRILKKKTKLLNVEGR